MKLKVGKVYRVKHSFYSKSWCYFEVDSYNSWLDEYNCSDIAYDGIDSNENLLSSDWTFESSYGSKTPELIGTREYLRETYPELFL